MRVREVRLPDGWTPYAVAAGPDGMIWTTVLDPPALAGLRDGVVVRRHPLPDEVRPMLLTAAPDGTIWYTRTDDRVGRIGPDGDETLFALPAGAAPYGMALAPDGAAWFSAPGAERIGFVTAGGGIRLVELPVPDARAAMVTVSADGVVWVALNGAAALAGFDGTGFRIVELGAGAAPVGIAAGGDGIWFADIAGGAVGLVRPDGTPIRVPFDDPGSRPHAVAPDPAGGCWATLWGAGELARVTADGEVIRHPLPGKEPHGLALTDATVWVAMESGSLVALDRD
ncbi:virginiamycin B lyase [Actinoplanes octamycinicus]|uniref:Virginiamycin B lyase n=1 Tax=Actinoplanes octamycinicus TaxID=135948 RepID=A0A7W7GZL8_9ACTN|nr:hydrolase [Actinoplanes octamycinicus]MBB4741179.1 virginiamycin B lyase [Actinoplanes octamycinicus]GIE56085.1 virginiamycin B lyase [Actinoplanes octamycinicus]